MYTTQFKDGNYLWDSDNGCLVQYYDTGSRVIKGIPNHNQANTSFPIPVNEELLCNVLGFSTDGSGGFFHGDKRISFSGSAPYGVPYSLDNQPIRYLNDIQNIYDGKQNPIIIDENKLFNFLNK